MPGRRTRILRISKIVVAAILIYFVLSETWVRVVKWLEPAARKRIGLTKEGPHVIFKSPLSPNKVNEAALDANGDGKVDEWAVHIWEGEPWKCEYYLQDLDSDGTPDIWQVAIGDLQASFALFDDDNDAKPDRLGAIIADFSDKNTLHYYQDLNLDGVIDTAIKSTSSETHGKQLWQRHVCLDDIWVLTSKDDREPADLREARIIKEDGSEDKVIFDGDKWRVVE
jgi:hypothetical protein